MGISGQALYKVNYPEVRVVVVRRIKFSKFITVWHGQFRVRSWAVAEWTNLSDLYRPTRRCLTPDTHTPHGTGHPA